MIRQQMYTSVTL